MEEIIILIVTVFLIFKLKESLGKRRENKETQKAVENFLEHLKNDKDFNSTSYFKTDNKKVIKIVDLTKDVDTSEKKIFNPEEIKFDFQISKEVENVLKTMEFSKTEFLNNLDEVVDIINKAWNDKNIDEIKNFLSSVAYTNFYNQFESFERDDKFFQTDLISILSKNFSNIYIMNKRIYIDIVIQSEQINFIINSKNEVVGGSKKKINKIEELWIFSKDIFNKEKYWIIENIVGL